MYHIGTYFINDVTNCYTTYINSTLCLAFFKSVLKSQLSVFLIHLQIP